MATRQSGTCPHETEVQGVMATRSDSRLPGEVTVCRELRAGASAVG